ncbi:MAG: AsnC family transcriptional regulator [Nanoarchaeales archaeon]|nr:AsnC family transcriptional regulator [Nanoarchaeales archaeon]
MDKKDLQIMEIYAQNCRIPTTTIAKALKLSKDTISYKINNLIKQKHIKQNILFIDSRVLGFTRYHILLRFDIGVKNKQDIIKLISKHKYVMWTNSFIGRYDLQIILDATDSFHLNKIREELFELCENKIKEYIILTHLSDLEFTQLNPILNLNTKFQKKLDHSFSNILCTKSFPVSKDFVKYNPTLKEIEILNILSQNPQESLINISRELNIDRNTVKKKIINLIEKKVIINFGAIPNLSKQGFVTYFLLVRIKQNTPHEILKKPFLKLQNIFYAGNFIGDYDLILYFNARNPEELNSSIELFKKHTEEYIIHYDLLVQDKNYNWIQFTKGIYENLKKKIYTK